MSVWPPQVSVSRRPVRANLNSAVHRPDEWPRGSVPRGLRERALRRLKLTAAASSAAPSEARTVKVGLPTARPTFPARSPVSGETEAGAGGHRTPCCGSRTCWPAGPCPCPCGRLSTRPLRRGAGSVGGVPPGCSLPAAGRPGREEWPPGKGWGPARAPPRARARRTGPRSLTCAARPGPAPRRRSHVTVRLRPGCGRCFLSRDGGRGQDGDAQRGEEAAVGAARAVKKAAE